MNKKIRFLVESSMIAAAYVALTLAIYPLSFGEVQFRLSEVLTVLPAILPSSIPGLTVGCFIANIVGPYSWIDAIFGTSATLLASVCTYLTRKIKFKNLPLLSFAFPVLFNAILVGLEINIFFLPQGETFTFAGFIISALWVGLGELVVCYLLGTPFYLAITKSKILSKRQVKYFD